ncbi:hypothetical protein H0H87_003125 [Tephrocybe sp. NHM501043]|nr:hypothetical protein H0H87_003125 [Tephrocybe sp. NHM501043]
MVLSKDFLAQAGDPTATGTGGESIWSHIASGSSSSSVPRYFEPEIRPKLKHTSRGTVSMAVAPALENHKGGCGSQFFITLADNIDYLDGKHAVFGHVVEGLDTLDKMNDVFTDQDGRPFKDIRIRHVVILDDPFPDPPGLVQPPSSPTRPPDNSTRIAEDEDPLATLPEEEEEKIRREKAAAASALTLEMVGDLPFANVRPPENVLFVCKLNSVTRDEDLELIFSRFGTIMSCQVIRDKRTGDSLQYAFIEFDKREDAEQAYFKMQNVLVDDRRIWVDFSQSRSQDYRDGAIEPLELTFWFNVVLQSCETENPTQFHVHRCILSAASPFFHDMFTLPQDPTVSHHIPVVPVSEARGILETLLQFVYPVEDPYLDSLDELVPILCAAVKYDFIGVITVLRKLLVSHRFIKSEPLRVYAIASRFELENEARIASEYTLDVQILDAPLSEDLKHITAYSYHRLLDLHRRRARDTIALLKIPPDIKCMQCNGSAFSIHMIPKWWYQFEKKAKEELCVRPTSAVIFGMQFLAQVVMDAECPRCAGSILDAWKFLEALKKGIDALPKRL